MHVEKKLQSKMDLFVKNRPIPSDRRLLSASIVYSLFLFIIISLYYVAYSGTYSLQIANRVLADVGLILIGLSFMLSGLCYFWNFADHAIIYRKHFGLAGFSYAITHSILSLFFMSNLFPFPDYYLKESNIISFLCALIAICVYIVMAVVSNRFAVTHLGGKVWKRILHAGYLAFILTIFHFGIKGFPFWANWFMGKSTVVPPFSLIMFLFGATVLGLRLALFISTLKAQPAPPHAPQTSPQSL